MGIRILAYRPVNSDLALRLTAFDGSVSVSYTHLDVYKRQTPGCGSLPSVV